MSYLAGLDIGQVVDHMALCVVETSPNPPVSYRLIFCYRWPLGRSNAVMIRDIKHVLATLPGNVYLNVDYTGKGAVFAEFLERSFQEAPRLRNVMTDYSVFTRAMKENLVSNVKLLLGEDRLSFSIGDGVYKEMVEELFDELCNYQVRITESKAQGKPASELGALGYGQHDDLATALFLALEDAEMAPTTASLFWMHR